MLITLSKLVAPLLPMLAEEIHTGLTGDRSVHLADWPVAGGRRDLHRAGEMLRQVGDVIANAHEAEAMLAYHRAFPEPPFAPATSERGLSL